MTQQLYYPKTQAPLEDSPQHAQQQAQKQFLMQQQQLCMIQKSMDNCKNSELFQVFQIESGCFLKQNEGICQITQQQYNQLMMLNLQKIQRRQGVLGPLNSQKKYTLVLDLDETLIHTYSMDGVGVDLYERPGYENFLKKMSKVFEIVVFTAARQEYANPIIDCLDPNGYIEHRLFRQHMSVRNGKAVKCMKILGRDLRKCILVDNMGENLEAQKENGYLIKDFLGDSEDMELYKLQYFLERIVNDQVDDVRESLKRKDEILEGFKLKLNGQEMIGIVDKEGEKSDLINEQAVENGCLEEMFQKKLEISEGEKNY